MTSTPASGVAETALIRPLAMPSQPAFRTPPSTSAMSPCTTRSCVAAPLIALFIEVASQGLQLHGFVRVTRLVVFSRTQCPRCLFEGVEGVDGGERGEGEPPEVDYR